MKTAIPISLLGRMLFALSPVIGREAVAQRWAIIATKPLVEEVQGFGNAEFTIRVP